MLHVQNEEICYHHTLLPKAYQNKLDFSPNSLWYLNGNYLVIMVSASIILPLALMKQLGEYNVNISLLWEYCFPLPFTKESCQCVGTCYNNTFLQILENCHSYKLLHSLNKSHILKINMHIRMYRHINRHTIEHMVRSSFRHISKQL